MRRHPSLPGYQWDGEVSTTEWKADIEEGVIEACHVMGTDFFTTTDMFTVAHPLPYTLTALALGTM